jgi:hypothetical protein
MNIQSDYKRPKGISSLDKINPSFKPVQKRTRLKTNRTKNNNLQPKR